MTGAADYNPYMKFLIGGTPGAGKTLLSSEAPGVFFASAEAGLMSVARKRVRFKDINHTDDLLRLKDRLNQDPDVRTALFGGPVETLVVDTIDEIQRLFIAERKAAKRKDTFDIQDWGWLGDRMREVLRSLRNLDMNVIFTMHTKEVTDGDTGRVYVKPALQGAIADEIAQFMDLSLVLTSETETKVVGDKIEKVVRRYLQTYPDERHDWVKDRSGQLPPRIYVNFEDDWDRLHQAVYGWITEDWKQEAEAAVKALEEATKDQPEPEQELAEAAVGREEPSEVVEGEPLSSEAPPVDVVPPGGFECESCGDKYDSQDQYDLSDLMEHKSLCSACYKKARESK